jgi:hypothetical protein
LGQRKSRKVLLILDNHAAHPECSECLKNIQLEFLAVNITSLVQANGYGNHKKFEDVVPRKVGEPHPRCDSRKSTDIIFHRQGSEFKG